MGLLCGTGCSRRRSCSHDATRHWGEGRVTRDTTSANDYEIVDTNAENIGRCDFCGYKDPAGLGHRRKANWLKAR